MVHIDGTIPPYEIKLQNSSGGGSTWRVNWVLFFGGLGLKLPNNSTRYKVRYYETIRLYFMSGGTKIGYEEDALRERQDWILKFKNGS